MKEHQCEGTCLFVPTGLPLKTQTGFCHIFLPAISGSPLYRSVYFTGHRFAGLKGENWSPAWSIITAPDVLSTTGKRQIQTTEISVRILQNQCYMYGWLFRYTHIYLHNLLLHCFSEETEKHDSYFLTETPILCANK